MQNCFIEDENGKLSYWKSEVFDKDNTLFFLHGLTANHTMFDEQLPYFEGLYNIITWDAPMHAESRDYKRLDMDTTSNLIKRILEECNISSVILVGQSLGGYLSQAFIMRYPDMVKAFVSIDSSSYGYYYSKSDVWWIKQLDWMAKAYTENILKKSMANQNALTEEGRANMLDMLKYYNKTELINLMSQGYKAFFDDNRPFKINCPVVLLVGEKDKTGKVVSYNREWTRDTGYEMIIIPDAAHNSNVDNPKAVNYYIKEFLYKNDIV